MLTADPAAGREGGALLAIKARWVLDGTGRPPVDRGVVLVEHGRIKAVGRQAGTVVPPGADVIDCGAHTVLPGFVDAHSHASIVPGLGDQIGQLKQPPAPQVLRAVRNLRADLRSGVTTMRVVGEEHFIDVALRQAIAEGRVAGPRLLVATRPITARNGHGAALTFSDGEDEIRRHIRENVAAGADLIKLFMTGGVSSRGTAARWYAYSRREVEVAVEEAHRNNMPVAVHAHGGPGDRHGGRGRDVGAREAGGHHQRRRRSADRRGVPAAGRPDPAGRPPPGRPLRRLSRRRCA